MLGVDLNEVGEDDYGIFFGDYEEYEDFRRGSEVDEEIENDSGYDSGDLNCDVNGSDEDARLNGVGVSNESILGAIGKNCPLEILMEDKVAEDITVDDVLGMEFRCVEGTEIFYRKYALFVAFSVRRDEMKRDENGWVVMRRWLCSRAGVRRKRAVKKGNLKRKRQGITRVKCPAEIQVNYDKEKRKYVVARFNPNHNHSLVSAQQLHLLRSNRRVTSSALASAVALCRVGVNTRQIMDLMVSQSGGYQNVGYTKQDLQNALTAFACKEVEVSDAETCLSYLRAKGVGDNGMYLQYSVDDRNRLHNLFWADSTSRYDYTCFGSVVGFDATYNRNKYRKPVVMMIGSNSHWRTIVFGIAILGSETFEDYRWLLQRFVQCMNGVEPVTVITDGDKAMRAAVREVFPSAYHRLCAWHLARNAQTYVKSSAFLSVFSGLMFGDCSTSEFEIRWAAVVRELGLHNNRWVSAMYRMKHMWARAYTRGTFFAGMRTTQRCESLNGILKEHFKIRFKLYKFVEEMDRVLLRIRNNELRDDCKSRHTDVEIASHLKSFESEAASVFTRPIFFMVRDEIFDERELVVEKSAATSTYTLYVVRQYLRPEKEWTVLFRRFDMLVLCSCKLFESEGIPCCHIFSVLKCNDVARIPKSLINRRWTKDAKPMNDLQSISTMGGDAKVKEMAKFGALVVAGNKAFRATAKDDQKFKELINVLHSYAATTGIDNVQGTPVDNVKEGWKNVGDRGKKVSDPPVACTKGAPRKGKLDSRRRNRCGKCKLFGHNARNCKKKGKSGPSTSKSKFKKRTTTVVEEGAEEDFFQSCENWNRGWEVESPRLSELTL